MTWALKRQIIFVSILVVFFLGLGYFAISPYINKIPTCTDGKQNGDEVGVDCGGSCALVCTFEADRVSVLWSRIFKVVPGRYNGVAYLENHNTNSVVSKISYRFRFADKDNIYIGKREGETFIPPGARFAIFEPAIGVGNSIPVFTSFEFTSIPVWVKVSEDKLKQLKLKSSDLVFLNQDTKPILSATIANNSLFTIPEVGVVVILYDESGNAVNTSRTYIDELGPEEPQIINFTWPLPIPGNIVEKEILFIYDILKASLK